MSRSRDKGTAWETAVCRHLAGGGFPHAERRALHGSADRGDIAGIVGWVLSAKNCQRTELAGWIDEAALQQANAGADYSAVWHHRRGKASPGDGFVTMTGATFVRLLREAGFGEPLPTLPVDPHPECPDQFHGADGGPCPTCGWDSHPIAPQSGLSATHTAETASPKGTGTPEPQNGSQGVGGAA